MNRQPEPDEVEEIIRGAAAYMKEAAATAEIAFFGGSFTAIDKGYMVSLLKKAHEAVERYGFHGVRISTRPDKIDDEVLSLLKAYSVTSIELGAQSMSDRVLEANERGHSAQSVRTAAALIKEYGFELGVQMMTGLYQSSPEADMYTAQELIKLTPDTVRIYPTVTLENTRLCDLYQAGEYTPAGLDETVELCARLISLFENQGIKVIRAGLHASEEISGNRVAGPYHPAFRELCMSRMYFNELKSLLDGLPGGTYEIRVHPRLVSAVTGQKRSNITAFEKLGYRLKLVQSTEENWFSLGGRL